MKIFSRNSSESHWLSISDLMSGLMMVFMLISLAYMHAEMEKRRQLEEKNAELDRLLTQYQTAQKTAGNVLEQVENATTSLTSELEREFGSDLERWGAGISSKGEFFFKEPDTLFSSGKSEPTQKLKEILAEFFPRYIRMLRSGKVRGNIEEIRIEGHTSSEWSGARPDPDSLLKRDDAYFENMGLSQERTRAVLEYCYGLMEDPELRKFMKSRVTANGLSSSHPIFKEDAPEEEDKKASRRVVFRVLTDLEKQALSEIGSIVKKDNKTD